jgi:putative transposase
MLERSAIMKKKEGSWSVDFGHINAVPRAQMLVVIDDETRLIVGLRLDTAFTAPTVLAFLDEAISSHGAPARITSDRGLAVSDPAVARWAKDKAIEWKYADSPTARTPVERVVYAIAGNESEHADIASAQAWFSDKAADYNTSVRESRS